MDLWRTSADKGWCCHFFWWYITCSFQLFPEFICSRGIFLSTSCLWRCIQTDNKHEVESSGVTQVCKETGTILDKHSQRHQNLLVSSPSFMTWTMMYQFFLNKCWKIIFNTDTEEQTLLRTHSFHSPARVLFPSWTRKSSRWSPQRKRSRGSRKLSWSTLISLWAALNSFFSLCPPSRSCPLACSCGHSKWIMSLLRRSDWFLYIPSTCRNVTLWWVFSLDLFTI